MSLPRAGFKYRAALFPENLALWLAHQFRQLRDIRRDLPRPIAREQLSGRVVFVLERDVGKLLRRSRRGRIILDLRAYAAARQAV